MSFGSVLLTAGLWLALSPSQARIDTSAPTVQQTDLQHSIVVTATRIETPAREVGSSLTVVDGTEIDRSRQPILFDALRTVPGLALLQTGGPGAAASAFVRGANSEHLLVLLDGVEVNDPMNPSRSFDLAHLAAGRIERVEVLRGPQSPLYGSDALGGVINILTRKGSGPARFSLTAQGGAGRTAAAALEGGGSTGAIDYSFVLSRYSTEGVSAASSAYAGNTEKDGYRNMTFSGRAGLVLGRGAEADLIVRAVDTASDLDSFGGPGGDDPNSVQKYRSLFVRGQGRVILAGNAWEQRIGLSYVGARRDNDNPVDAAHPSDSDHGTFRSSLLKLDWQNNIFLSPDHTLTFGLDLSRENGSSEYTYVSAWGASDSPFPARTEDIAGFYAQDKIRIGGAFYAAVGARYDHHSRAGAALTFRIAPAVVLDSVGLKLKASYGTAFKAPSLYQLYAEPTLWGPIGNADLAPERSAGWDAGIEKSFGAGAVTAGLTYFRNDFRNLIDYNFSLGYVNIGRARTRGIEAAGEVRPGDRFGLRLAYTRLEAVDLDSGAPLMRRPNDLFSAVADWTPGRRWTIYVSATYTGTREDREYVGFDAWNVTLPAYTLADAAVSYRISRRWQVFVRADNLFDARYEPVFGYGAPGRRLFAGFQLN
jgi:vitamin B12 transporter